MDNITKIFEPVCSIWNVDIEKDDENTMDDEDHKQRCPQTNEEQETHGNNYSNKEI